ncbi:MAG: 6-phosphogluconolactonase [Nostocoides sp.]
MTASPQVEVHPDKQTLADAAGARLLLVIVDAQARHDGPVHLVLTGGSMGSAVLASFGAMPDNDAIHWGRIHLWWGDERYLPAGDPDRNQTQNGAALLESVPIPAANVHAVAGPDSSASAEASAAVYAQAVAEQVGGSFDIVLLGVGSDGHIASLFPHHPAQRTEGTAAVAVHDSPKPPPDRVSLTFERLGRARQVWFLVSGADKAQAVSAALAPETDRWDVPASGVKGQDLTIWLLDAPAAGRVGDVGRY